MPRRDLAQIRTDLAELEQDLAGHTSEIRHFEIAPDSRFVNQPLHSIQMPPDTLVISIRRGTAMLIPSGDTVLEAGDRITVIGKWGSLDAAGEQIEG